MNERCASGRNQLESVHRWLNSLPLSKEKKTKKKEIRPFYKPDVINMLVLTFLHVPRGEKCGWGETEGEPLTYD